jgi:ABC-type sugar transport system permease subunit
MTSPAVAKAGPGKGPAFAGGRKGKASRGSLTRQKQRIGLFAALPAFIVVASLLFYPIGYAVWISFLKTDGVTSKFIGFKNYVDIFEN